MSTFFTNENEGGVAGASRTTDGGIFPVLLGALNTPPRAAKLAASANEQRDDIWVLARSIPSAFTLVTRRDETMR